MVLGDENGKGSVTEGLLQKTTVHLDLYRSIAKQQYSLHHI